MGRKERPVAKLLSLDRIRDVVGAQGEALDDQLRLALRQARSQRLAGGKLADAEIVATDPKLGHYTAASPATLPRRYSR